MTVAMLLPGFFALSLAIGFGVFQVPLNPRLAMRVITVGAAAVSATVVAVLVITATAFVLGPTRSDQLTQWCRIIPLHHRVGPIAGWAAIAGLTFISARIARIALDHRRALLATPNQRIAVIDTARPLAYAVPRGLGCVVVSSGLMAVLAPSERKVVFAHERAHLTQRHHLYLLTGAIAQAIVPMLSPLLVQLRHATERCADEAAAEALGGDRQLVATAVARAAVLTHEFGATIPSFGGGSVRKRVDALLGEGPSPVAARIAAVTSIAWLGATVAGSSLQVHHVMELFVHICRG